MFNNSFNIFTYIFSFLLFLMCLNSSAIANPKYSSIIMEEHSGKILYSRSPNEKRYPASMTKVMTLYIVFEEIEKGTLNYNSKITFSKRAAGQPPSKIGLNIGQSIKLKEETITGEQEARQTINPYSSIKVTQAQLQSLPTLAEADIFRTLQALPGVLQASEFSTGLIIRGGNTDQN